MTNCFMLASGQAKLLYGDDIVGKELPKPVCVQFVYTDGQHFHFAAYQLNTLKLDGDDGVKNVFWEGEAEDGWTNEYGDAGEHRSKMFETCEYDKAIPTLEGYSPKAFNRFLAMYSQQ